MPRVRNLVTGLVFNVPGGHYSLDRPDLFEVLPEAAAKPEPVKVESKPPIKPKK